MQIERIDFVQNYETRDCYIFINNNFFVKSFAEEHGRTAFDLLKDVADALGRNANRFVYVEELCNDDFTKKWGDKI